MQCPKDELLNSISLRNSDAVITIATRGQQVSFFFFHHHSLRNNNNSKNKNKNNDCVKLNWPLLWIPFLNFDPLLHLSQHVLPLHMFLTARLWNEAPLINVAVLFWQQSHLDYGWLSVPVGATISRGWWAPPDSLLKFISGIIAGSQLDTIIWSFLSVRPAESVCLRWVLVSVIMVGLGEGLLHGCLWLLHFSVKRNERDRMSMLLQVKMPVMIKT